MSHPDWVGRTLGGRYRLEALIGQGGMAAVYRGHDPNLNRPVAVKLIHSHLTSDPRFVRRFEAEAEAVAQLRHPNIIQVFDFSHDGPTYYMVLELLPGETLHARLDRLSQAGTRLPLADAAAIIATVAQAVHAAHQRGLVHRDIKPANIMLEPDDRVILMDFGIAKIANATGMTATGNMVGTARYLAPELVLGKPPSPRSDIYSLGITLFEMVAGEPPFDADSLMGLMQQHVHQPPPDLRGLNPAAPPELAAVVERALHKDPAQRYASAEAMAAELRALAGTLATAGPPQPPRTGRDDERTVVDQHQVSLPPVVEETRGPAQPPQGTGSNAQPPPPPVAPPRRPSWLAPLLVVAAAAVVLVCVVVATGGGLLGLASLNGLFARPTATSTLAAGETYTHPSGAFTFSLPEGWLISEGSTGVSAYPPDQSAMLRIDFTHAGARLDQAGLEAFVMAVETNYFAHFGDYARDGLTVQPEGRLTVMKTLAVQNGPPQTVFSTTWQDGPVVYEQHLWIPTADYDRRADTLLAVAATLETDSAAGADAPVYFAAYPFTTPNGAMEFSVPYAWTHRTYDNADGHVDEFASPDESTFVGAVTYEADQTFTADTAGEFAAYLLGQYYAADLPLATEQDAGEGRVRVVWTSTTRGTRGVSIYATRGPLFSMLNWTVPPTRYNVYLPLWDQVLGSLQLP